jgi:hypothetical protein
MNGPTVFIRRRIATAQAWREDIAKGLVIDPSFKARNEPEWIKSVNHPLDFDRSLKSYTSSTPTPLHPQLTQAQAIRAHSNPEHPVGCQSAYICRLALLAARHFWPVGIYMPTRHFGRAAKSASGHIYGHSRLSYFKARKAIYMATRTYDKVSGGKVNFEGRRSHFWPGGILCPLALSTSLFSSLALWVYADLKRQRSALGHIKNRGYRANSKRKGSLPVSERYSLSLNRR